MMTSRITPPLDAALQVAGQLAAARGELYRFLGRQLAVAPGTQHASKSALWDEWAACAGPLDSEHLMALDAYLRSPGCTLAGLDREFMELFGMPTGRYLAPIESAYRGGDNGAHTWAPESLRGPCFHAVQEAYARVGFVPEFEPALENDHLACELAFVGFLCDVEAAAWRGDDVDTVKLCRQRALEFLVRHPLRWCPAVRRRSSAVTSDPYYEVTFTVVEEFLHLEAAQLRASEAA